MATFHDRRSGTDYSVTATDPQGSKYTVHGRDSKEAGRSMAHHLANGMVPAGSQVTGSRMWVHYSPDRGGR